MLELSTYNLEQFKLNRKDRITIELINDGREFLERFDINHEILMDAVSLIYRFLRITGKIPHNLYKFYISAYYIISRHPIAFPEHGSKKSFCRKFGIEPASLEYCVDRLVFSLGFLKLLDDKNFPYFINPRNDMIMVIANRVVGDEVERAHLDFLLGNGPVNTKMMCEDITTYLIFEQKMFPEELLRPFYDIILDLIEKKLKEQKYYDYIKLQQQYFV